MGKRSFESFLILGMAAGLAGCTQSAPPAAANPPSASMSRPDAAPPEELLVASGPLILENQVDVVAQREGIVTKINKEIGDRVRAGDLLAQIDDRQITADLNAARAKTRSIAADLNNWKSEAKVLASDFERAQKMWDAQLITQQQLDHARYKMESDHWDIKRVEENLVNSQETEKSLELELEKTRIRAPFDGTVARRYIRSGQKVSSGDRLFWVTGGGPLCVRFTLAANLLSKVKIGQELPLTSPDLPTENRRAKIIEISPVVDPASGTIEVLAELIGAPGELRPGMTANLRFSK